MRIRCENLGLRFSESLQGKHHARAQTLWGLHALSATYTAPFRCLWFTRFARRGRRARQNGAPGDGDNGHAFHEIGSPCDNLHRYGRSIRHTTRHEAAEFSRRSSNRAVASNLAKWTALPRRLEDESRGNNDDDRRANNDEHTIDDDDRRESVGHEHSSNVPESFVQYHPEPTFPGEWNLHVHERRRELRQSVREYKRLDAVLAWLHEHGVLHELCPRGDQQRGYPRECSINGAARQLVRPGDRGATLRGGRPRANRSGSCGLRRYQRGAQRAAQTNSAPSVAAGYTIANDTQDSPGFGGAWSSGYSVLVADYVWMYDDGWAGSTTATSNVACTSANASGCWAHRDELLGSETNYDPGVGLGCTTCQMGAGFAMVDGNASYVDVVEGPQGSLPPMTFTWTTNVLPT